eukprot:908796-Prymnesium_polylepis.1
MRCASRWRCPDTSGHPSFRSSCRRAPRGPRARGGERGDFPPRSLFLERSPLVRSLPLSARSPPTRPCSTPPRKLQSSISTAASAREAVSAAWAGAAGRGWSRLGAVWCGGRGTHSRGYSRRARPRRSARRPAALPPRSPCPTVVPARTARSARAP